MLIEDPIKLLPENHEKAILLGRIRMPRTDADPGGVFVVRVTANEVYDLTPYTPTLSDIINQDDAVEFLTSLPGTTCIASFEEIATNTLAGKTSFDKPCFISPVDLQPVKACGVTFHDSLIERIIEERAEGNKELALSIRAELLKKFGSDFDKVKPGSSQALELLALLKQKNLWSQYLEVALGVDAEIFSKAPPLASVGTGAEIGILPVSLWNNPEPELTLIINNKGRIVGATLGNDVNHRDIEGRSALLLGKAKDNNAACALGPFIRLVDSAFTLEDLRNLEVKLEIEGEDNYVSHDQNNVANIRRDIDELVNQCIGACNHYPDGVALMLGAMSSPTQDRNEKGMGFTHKLGDIVRISSPKLGTLVNRVQHTDKVDAWSFGISELMKNLAQRSCI